MKNLLTKCLLVCIAILFVSCKDDVIEYPPLTTTVFSFKERVTIIEVDENVSSFRLEGVFSDTTNFDINEEWGGFWFPAEIDRAKTTAQHNVHFINNVESEYERDRLNVFQEIELIPENIIGEGVQIVYYSAKTESSYNYPDDFVFPIRPNLIDTTIIKLVPKKKAE